jgi:hypothetical protein
MTSTSSINRDNRLLSMITHVTSLGDFLSFFAVMEWFNRSGTNTAIASYTVVAKALAVACGGILLPTSIGWLSTRTLLITSQALSFVLSATLLLMVWFNVHSPFFIIIVFAGVSLLKQLFDGARETHSKHVARESEQLQFQAQLLTSFYSAQFIGPIASFFLVKFLPIEIPFALDAVSFLLAAIAAVGLTSRNIHIPKINILRPLGYLWINLPLRDIFLMRSIGMWFSLGLFNYLMFSVVVDHYGLTLTHTAWVYSALGLGAAVSSSILRKYADRLFNREYSVAFAAQCLFAVTIFGFFKIPSFLSGFALILIMGCAMGANAVSTQALRRRFATNDQFPEVVGLEMVIGKLADSLIASIACQTLLTGTVSFQQWLVVSSLLIFVSGLIYFRFAAKPKIVVSVEPSA